MPRALVFCDTSLYAVLIPNVILMRHMLLVIDSLTHSSQFLSFLSTETRHVLTLTYKKLLILISCLWNRAKVCVARFLRIIYFGKGLGGHKRNMSSHAGHIFFIVHPLWISLGKCTRSHPTQYITLLERTLFLF